MGTPTFGTLDPAALAGLEPFPLTLLSDGDRATADITLDGELWPGGAYSYAFEFAAGAEYRLQASAEGATGGDLAILVDRTTGDIVWGSTAALESFGFDRSQAADLADDPLSFDQAGVYQLVLWEAPAEPGSEPSPSPFHFEARVDAPPVIVVDPPPPPPTDDAVYRFFDPVLQIERLTANVALRDQLLAERPDLRYDGAVFVGDDQPRDGWVPVFELLDQRTGRLYYTADLLERDALVAGSPALVDQGTVFHVPGTAGENTESVYRMENIDNGAWFFTSNVNERLYLLLQGDWADEGIAFNAWVPPPVVPAADPLPPGMEALPPDSDLGASEPVVADAGTTDIAAYDTATGDSPEVTAVGVAADAPPLIG